ncbi:hypothetical protein RHMOL_Rhmol03G0028700 [Rhododendron molle]|uniref:Uncharacterized protein n=1 Tax=Rhododendron molle TaxID=49168 RepID=A0ACC0PBE7_RHOML|nr:hypothetical protein RHMOL_Rhmol03G0028700 [Rhododendron molle]
MKDSLLKVADPEYIASFSLNFYVSHAQQSPRPPFPIFATLRLQPAHCIYNPVRKAVFDPCTVLTNGRYKHDEAGK